MYIRAECVYGVAVYSVCGAGHCVLERVLCLLQSKKNVFQAGYCIFVVYAAAEYCVFMGATNTIYLQRDIVFESCEILCV